MKMFNSMKKLYCFVGPSGTGKSTLVKNIKNELDFMNSVESYTTRPKRSEDETGHTFITEDEFDELSELVAYTEFAGYRYGVTAEQLDEADLYIVDKAGLVTLKQNYSGADIIVIGLDASEETRSNRMAKRGDSKDQIANRLVNDAVMFQDFKNHCDLVIDANKSENEMLAQFINEAVNL